MTEMSTETKARVLDLMHMSMPSFETFLEHTTTLKSECEKAGAMTPEREVLFTQYREALVAARGEYDDVIATFIGEHFATDEIETLIAFYSSPTFKVVEKALGLGATINNLSTAWQTKVLERCPDVWKMLVENIGEWQKVNTPEDSEVTIPDAPPSNGGWKRIDLKSVPAEEYIPTASAEEAELAKMQSDGGSAA